MCRHEEKLCQHWSTFSYLGAEISQVEMDEEERLKFSRWKKDAEAAQAHTGPSTKDKLLNTSLAHDSDYKMHAVDIQ